LLPELGQCTAKSLRQIQGSFLKIPKFYRTIGYFAQYPKMLENYPEEVEGSRKICPAGHINRPCGPQNFGKIGPAGPKDLEQSALRGLQFLENRPYRGTNFGSAVPQFW